MLKKRREETHPCLVRTVVVAIRYIEREKEDYEKEGQNLPFKCVVWEGSVFRQKGKAMQVYQ